MPFLHDLGLQESVSISPSVLPSFPIGLVATQLPDRRPLQVGVSFYRRQFRLIPHVRRRMARKRLDRQLTGWAASSRLLRIYFARYTTLRSKRCEGGRQRSQKISMPLIFGGNKRVKDINTILGFFNLPNFQH